MLLQVCSNGARPPDAHPVLAAGPNAVAADAAGAVRAGAGEIHLHPKDAEGRDSLHPEDVARWCGAARAASPGVPVGVTTGAWAASSDTERVALVSAWTVLPDLASVNWHEPGADAVAAALLALGVAIEAGIWHAEGLARWAASSQRGACHRALIEVGDLDHDAETTAHRLIEGVQSLEPDLPLLVHGEERSTWTVLALARREGHDSRIGLEDTLTLPDGADAAGNGDLVRAALGLARDRNRRGRDA